MKNHARAAALSAAAIGWLLLQSPAFADDEASNRPLVVASAYGNCYAKSVPAESYGNAGQTRVYRVENEADTLAATYDWYANRLRLECNVAGPNDTIGLSVVAFGPWARGERASGRATRCWRWRSIGRGVCCAPTRRSISPAGPTTSAPRCRTIRSSMRCSAIDGATATNSASQFAPATAVSSPSTPARAQSCPRSRRASEPEGELPASIMPIY